MAKKQRIIYYQDELHDEFSGDNIQAKPITAEYPYIRTGFAAKLKQILAYRVVATPLAYLYLKIYFHHKIVNHSAVKPFRRTGYFLYGNHTHFLADALIPTMISTPQDAKVIVHPNNVSMPFLGRVTPYMGALPLPDDLEAAKNFVRAVEDAFERKNCIMIYPEAHIWPYYTKIRPFPDLSFRYPVKCQSPVFCLTNTYQKQRFFKRPRLVTYLDGPFFPDPTLPPRSQRKALRDAVYQTMVERSQNSNYEKIQYKKKTEGNCHE